MAEIVILLNRLPPDWLIHQTNAAQFSLFCTPVINLFPRVTARIDVTHSTTEQHLVVDRTHPLDYEVFSVRGSGRAGNRHHTEDGLSPALPHPQ